MTEDRKLNNGAQQGAESRKVQDLIGELVKFTFKRYTRSGTGGRRTLVGKVREQAMTPGFVVIEGEKGGIHNRPVSEIEVMT